jgi:hypothetical protein
MPDLRAGRRKSADRFLESKDVIMILPTTKGNIMLAYTVSILALLSPAIMTVMTTTKK